MHSVASDAVASCTVSHLSHLLRQHLPQQVQLLLLYLLHAPLRHGSLRHVTMRSATVNGWQTQAQQDPARFAAAACGSISGLDSKMRLGLDTHGSHQVPIPVR